MCDIADEEIIKTDDGYIYNPYNPVNIEITLNDVQSILRSYGLPTTVVDARFAKPIDKELIKILAKNHEILVTVEEGSIGGFSAQVMSFLSMEGLLDNGLKFRPIFFPDKFINHGKPDEQIVECGVDQDNIVTTVLNALGITASAKLSLERA